MTPSFDVRRTEWTWVFIVALGVVVLASLPYLAIYLTTPPGLRFVGLLINPLDGNTYLAKMQLGVQGDWLFHLPYTAQDHPGALILTHYLALGHVAAWTRLPIPLVYHLARVVAGLALLLAIYALIARAVPGLAERRIAFFLVALASGWGWLAAMTGHLGTSDLLIPESNTFYALHVNPHFPLAMVLMVGVFLVALSGRSKVGRTVALAGMSLALAIVQPFAVAMAYLALGVYLGLRWRRDGHLAWRVVWPMVTAGIVTLPLLVYTYWVTQADPLLRGWMAQNVTLSPPVWDYALGYGMILVLAVPGAIRALRRRSDIDLLLLAWAGVTIVLLYLPFPLQRRFSFGLHIPLAILAAMGAWSLVRRKLIVKLAVASTPITTLLVLMLALAGGLEHDPRLFVSADEAAAMDWLKRNTPREVVVLASPEMGTFIPAWAGRRAVYGHPFETVNAEQTRARIDRFFASGADPAEREAMLREWRVAFVFVGPRERALGLTGDLGRQVFRNATVVIYAP